ncbi:ZAR1-like protein [Perognathus longimembris pacificus]|uniref:ZAR1-like protein n=1 Tax=Perognathus longimembris pacificus TaxID=214514 RepID=UPI00201A091F|nr:ZAR1-like protein [Perognathus longimembris pacificus]
MERFVRLPCGLYQGYGNTLPLSQPGLAGHKQSDWRQNIGHPTFLARPGLLMPANASDYYYMDPYKKAQLKAVLSQMNSNPGLRLSKANTKEIGIQVSLRVDKSVQCSLGPRTLRSCSPWDRIGHKEPGTGWGAYSQVTHQRNLIRLRNREDGKNKKLSGLEEASQQPTPTLKPEAEDYRQEELQQLKELEDAAGSEEMTCKQEHGDTDTDLPQKSNFQFLEAKYGYFHCKDCNTRWESAYVWCISGTNKVYFKQLCCKCQNSFNPYRVEAIQCQTCSKSRCSCTQKKRHIDLRKPHRQELCGRCKDKKFSCGNIYSFKYII